MANSKPQSEERRQKTRDTWQRWRERKLQEAKIEKTPD